MGGIHRHESSMDVFEAMGKDTKRDKDSKRNNPRNKILLHFVLFSHCHSTSNFDRLYTAAAVAGGPFHGTVQFKRQKIRGCRVPFGMMVNWP